MTAPRDPDRNDWDSSAYDGSHSFVYEYGSDVVDLLDPQPDERILDLGCGTGHLTDRIAGSNADVVGLDRDRGMIETARDSYPERRFRRVDARDFDVEEPFDAACDRAASLAEHSRLAQQYAKRAVEYEGDQAGLWFEALAFGHAADQIGESDDESA